MSFEKALLTVDVQNDFCPGGALGIPQSDRIIPVLNKYIALFHTKAMPIFATRDCHPAQTSHFKEFGGNWSIHCVKDTKGAQFHPNLKLPEATHILYKGMEPENDCFSAFHAKDVHGKSLHKLLITSNISEIYVGGLATDYCVKYTVLDALRLGYKVTLLLDATQGVDIKAGDSEKALHEMVQSGAKTITFDNLDI